MERMQRTWCWGKPQCPLPCCAVWAGCTAGTLFLVQGEDPLIVAPTCSGTCSGTCICQLSVPSLHAWQADDVTWPSHSTGRAGAPLWGRSTSASPLVMACLAQQAQEIQSPCTAFPQLATTSSWQQLAPAPHTPTLRKSQVQVCQGGPAALHRSLQQPGHSRLQQTLGPRPGQTRGCREPSNRQTPSCSSCAPVCRCAPRCWQRSVHALQLLLSVHVCHGCSA